MLMSGDLIQYRKNGQAFCSGLGGGQSRVVVYISGLTQGLLACPYVPSMAKECQSRGWGFVQPLLSSSYTGYGIWSLDKDCKELQELLEYLTRTYSELSHVVLMGHSTGCQDVVHFMKHAEQKIRKLVVGCVLQAAASLVLDLLAVADRHLLSVAS